MIVKTLVGWLRNRSKYEFFFSDFVNTYYVLLFELLDFGIPFYFQPMLLCTKPP